MASNSVSFTNSTENVHDSAHKSSSNYSNRLLDFESFIIESKNIIKGHCDKIRSDIEINYESIIDKIMQQKDALINRINSYESECINEVDEKVIEAYKFINDERKIKSFKVLMDTRAEFKSSIFKNSTIKYTESEIDPQIVMGQLEDVVIKYGNHFDFLNILDGIHEPNYKYSLNTDKIDPENEMGGVFEHFVIPFGIDRVVICILLKSRFQLRLLQKKGDLIRMYTFQPPSEFLSFCSNSTRLFMLADQDNIRILYEFDENLLLRRVKEVNNKSIKVSCDNSFVFMLIEKCTNSFCGYCFEIYTDSIQEIECGSFKFMKLHDPNINMDYNLSPGTRLEIYSQDDDTFVFYIDGQTIIEVFSKDKYMTDLIELKHNITPEDAFIFTTDRNIIQVLYKSNDTWYLVDKIGSIVKFRKYDGLKNSDKFCVTKDGSLVIITKELNIQIF